MKSKLFIMSFIISLLLAISACKQDVGAVRIGSNQWPGYEPMYLARELKEFTRDQVHLVELPSTSDVMQYIRNGSLDGGMLTLDEAITLVSEGLPLSVVLVLDISHGADAVIAQPSISRLADLKGKRVGVELSALGALMLESLLEQAKLTSEQITIVSVSIDNQEQAFLAGNIDAVVAFDPTRSHLLAKGGVEIFNSKQIPGRIIDVLAIRTDALLRQKDNVQAMVDGYFSARKFMAKKRSAAMSMMAPRMNMSPEELDQSFAGVLLPDRVDNTIWFEGDDNRLIGSTKKLIKLMIEYNLIEREPVLNNFVYAGFVLEN